MATAESLENALNSLSHALAKVVVSSGNLYFFEDDKSYQVRIIPSPNAAGSIGCVKRKMNFLTKRLTVLQAIKDESCIGMVPLTENMNGYLRRFNLKTVILARSFFDNSVLYRVYNA